MRVRNKQRVGRSKYTPFLGLDIKAYTNEAGVTHLRHIICPSLHKLSPVKCDSYQGPT